MDAFRINGGKPLSGTVRIAGSKNASLPLMAAGLLVDGRSVLRDVPDLVDIRTMSSLLETLGATVVRSGSDLQIDFQGPPSSFEAPYDLVRTMRASFLVLGPLLARFGRARVSLPGGCAIGARPIDQHLKGFERLGARVSIEHGYVMAETDGLTGGEVTFDMPTVGGTENLMLAASLAPGQTVLRNAAREPEIVDLANALKSMGAEISGAGTSEIAIFGVSELKPMDHRVVSDRIECGTFLVAGAMLGEGVVLENACMEHQAALVEKLRDAGAQIEADESGVTVHRADRCRAVSIQTAPYPGFPTDMQAQLMTMMTLSQGASSVSETIFENRFMHVAELVRMGASISVDGGKAVVTGVEQLQGTTVMATDLRASASLVLAGMAAAGETVIRRIYHLDRGYEALERKLQSLGADVVRFKET